MKKFLFLSVNSSYSHSSLALPILHNAAGNVSGWEWDFIECTVSEDCAEIAVQAAQNTPDLIGASLYLFNRQAVLNILSRISKLLPQAKIIVGGPECSGSGAADLLNEYPFIHNVFVGEAEGLFANYLDSFPQNTKRGILPENGRAQYDNWHEKFPVNDRFFNAGKAFVQLETSRGCPIGCKYCTSSHIPLRLKELSDVKQEISILHSRGVREIRLLDRTFNFPQKRGAELLRLFRENFPDIEFHLEIHPHFLNDELKNELRIAPNLHIEAGIQSFDEKVQQTIGRNCRKADAVEGMKFLASCNNFETHVDLICGLPEQTLASVLEDIAELIKLNVDEIQLETLKILHGTPLREQAENLQIIYSPAPPYDVMQTKHLASDEILYLRKVSRVLDLFHNHTMLRPIVRKLALNNGEAVKNLADFMLSKAPMLNSVFDLKKRLLLLADYVRQYPDKSAEFAIAQAWIFNNYPLNSIPFGTLTKFDGTLPEHLVEEHKKLLTHRETKLWSLRHNELTFNFALNRHFKLNGVALDWA